MARTLLARKPCTSCDGKGRIRFGSLRGPYDVEICHACGGSGETISQVPLDRRGRFMHILRHESEAKGGDQMKLAHAELPKRSREDRRRLDPEQVKTALDDLEGSADFEPHAFTDGVEYPTYSAAQAEANLYIREVADALKQDPRWLRRRVWEATGKNDRKAKGKWIFALSFRSTAPPPRKPKQAAAVAT